LLFAAVFVSGTVRADALTFEQLVHNGDLARFSGRNSDAVRAYMRALKLRNDPRIEGRLGIVALAGGAPAHAAPHLLRAIIDGSAIAPRELQQIQIAFNRARPLVSRIEIKISHVGAQVTIDGKPESMGTAATDFYVFRAPGHHEFRATLEGFEDAVVAIDTKKGETVDVSLVLTPLPSVPLNETPAEPAPVPAVKCEPCEQKEDWASVEDPPKRSAKESEDTEDKRVRWVPGIGGTILYGAVSPYPAGGFVLSSFWTAGPIFSGGFDIRVAFSPRGIESYQIRGGTFTLLPGLCATLERFTGCLIGHLGGMWHSTLSPLPYSTVRAAIGGGASLGFRFGRIGRFDLRASIYGELLADKYPLQRSGLSKPIWIGPPYLAGLSISAVWGGTK
jgi:PEGA domain